MNYRGLVLGWTNRQSRPSLKPYWRTAVGLTDYLFLGLSDFMVRILKFDFVQFAVELDIRFMLQ